MLCQGDSDNRLEFRFRQLSCIIGGAATNIIFVATKHVFFSDQHTFVFVAIKRKKKKREKKRDLRQLPPVKALGLGGTDSFNAQYMKRKTDIQGMCCCSMFCPPKTVCYRGEKRCQI